MSFSTIGLGSAGAPDGTGDTGLGVGFGTSILTMEGVLPVEFLSPGDRVITRAGARRLQSVEVTARDDAEMVLISHDILGQGRPNTDLIVHPGQPILIRDWRAKALYGATQALVPAARLVDGEYIRFEQITDVRLFTLRLEGEAVIYAGGLELMCLREHATA
jgi:hypothetical protein